MYFAKRVEGDLAESQFVVAKPGHGALPANAFSIRLKTCTGDKPDLRFQTALRQLMTELGKRGLTGKNHSEGWKVQYGKFKTFEEMKIKDFCCVWANTQRTLANWFNRMTDVYEALWIKLHEHDLVFKTNDPKAMMLFLFEIFDKDGRSYYDYEEYGFEQFEKRVVKILMAQLESFTTATQ